METINHGSGTLETIFAERSFNFDMLSITRAMLGIATLIFIAWLFSVDRKAISWNTVIKSLIIQVVIAFLVMFVTPVQDFFNFFGSCFVAVLGWTKAGSEFLFGAFVDTGKFGYIFAFQILPTIIFFSAFTSLLFYFGILQKIVWLFAWLMSRLIKLSGAESLSTVANIFVGMNEAPLVVKPYISKMSRSELMLVMTAGMSTMAGGVLAAYIGMLGNGIPELEIQFARHLLTASVMAAPGAVVISKILVPQTMKTEQNAEISKDKLGANVLEAISIGTIDGLKLAGNVAAMLLVFYALIAGGNNIISWLGSFRLMSALSFCIAVAGGCMAYWIVFLRKNRSSQIKFIRIKPSQIKYCAISFGVMSLLFTFVAMFYPSGDSINSTVSNFTDGRHTELSLQLILGYVFAPVIWLTGVAMQDVPLVGQLLGQKIILTEFVGYSELSNMLASNVFTETKSAIMATYVLCGFANFASVGIEIGGIGSIAPNQRATLSIFGMRALLGGTLAALISATIVGMMM
ncbi:MAG: Na+ dependent nucleoside transporter [Prevotellaceae bacterium]|jgi:CNT family concentrative nucleoside transporter|nr:Na+ dependent nucleoside transporter [Prevotellaceae bacterium]